MSSASNSLKSIMAYYPAELVSTGKCWYVRYYVLDPQTDKMVRMRVKVNRVKNATLRRRYARELCIKINCLLADGWNPLCKSGGGGKRFSAFADAIAKFRETKYREISSASVRCYNSNFLYIERFVADYPDMVTGSFDKRCAADLMLQIKETPAVGNRTYNNLLAFYRMFFNWLVEFDYAPENPFVKIPKVSSRLTVKKREYLDRGELKALCGFLEVENRQYLCACMLIYYCCLRPSDLSNLKLSSFDFRRNVIKIKGTETKNRQDSERVIPKALEKYLGYIQWERVQENGYIFSDTHLFTPGRKKIDSREFARYWADTVRPALGFGMDKQLYSLKDSGITNLIADGISPVYVQGQADHSSLDMTDKYTHKHTPEGYEQLRNLAKPIE